MRAWPRAFAVLLVYLCAWAALQAVPAVCAADKKESPVVRAKFFGEGGQTPPNAPDQTDYQNTSSIGSPVEGPKPTTLPSVSVPAPEPSAAPAAAPAPGAAQSTYRVVMPAQGPVPARSWPGRKRAPEPSAAPAEASSAEEEEGSAPVPVDSEPLKDAPNAMRYSLWNGLNAPMLLPANRATQVSPDQAKALGRADYDTHILGAAASGGGVVQDAAALDGLPARSAVAAPEGLLVSVDLDLSAQEGDYRDAVADLGVRSGLRIDERFPPSFQNPEKTRLTIRGWVLPDRLGDVFGPAVRRLRVERSASVRSVPDAPTTDILVGVRVPPGAAPAAALAQTLERLSRESGFRLRRVVGYQALPGTSRMVAILSGRVPVPQISRVLRDPAVVKIAPSPDNTPVPVEAPTAPDLLRGFIDRATARSPLLLSGTLLLTVLVFGTLFLHRRKR